MCMGPTIPIFFFSFLTVEVFFIFIFIIIFFNLLILGNNLLLTINSLSRITYLRNYLYLNFLQLSDKNGKASRDFTEISEPPVLRKELRFLFFNPKESGQK